MSPPHPEPLGPPSTCPRPPLRRRGCCGVAFWTTRCCCPSARPSSVKSPGGSAWSSRTRPTGFAWVSGLPSQPPLLTVSFLPAFFWPHCGPSSLSYPSLPTQPSVLTGPSLPLPRDAEDPAGAHGHTPGGRGPPFFSDPGAKGPAHLSWPLPCGPYCQPEGCSGVHRLVVAAPLARKIALPLKKNCSLPLSVPVETP